MKERWLLSRLVGRWGSPRPKPRHPPSYPPSSIVLHLEVEAGRKGIALERLPEGQALPARKDQVDRWTAFFADLDLTSIDRLFAATRSVMVRQSAPREESAAGVNVHIGRNWTAFQVYGDDAVERATTESLAASLGRYREFLASWTDGE